jgi:hypothetical protein
MRRYPTQLAKVLALAIVFGALSGCTQRRKQGDETTYRFEWWIAPAVAAAGLASIPIGIFLCRRTPRWGNRWLLGVMMLTVLPGVILGIVAPGVRGDRVIVDSAHFETTFGLWFSPTREVVTFADLTAIDVRARTERTRVGRRVTYDLFCKHKSGEMQIVPVGDLLSQAVDDILGRAQARGVGVTRIEPAD